MIKHLTEAIQRIRIDFHSYIQGDRVYHGKEAWQQAAGCGKRSRRLAGHIGSTLKKQTEQEVGTDYRAPRPVLRDLLSLAKVYFLQLLKLS